MATIAAAAIVAGGAAYAANSASKSADKQNAMIEEQMEEARILRRKNEALANQGFDNIEGLIGGLPGIEDFLTQGGEIADTVRSDRLNFILGGTEGDLRESQRVNTALAAYDFSGIGANLSKVVQGNLFDIASMTRDSIGGTFANYSVANMANMAAQGLGNAVNIGDYLGRISGIDQFNPYRMAQDLYGVEEARMTNRIQNESTRVNAITQNNNQWFANYANLSNAQMVVEANKTNAQISAVNTATSSIASMIGNLPARNAQSAQADYYKTLTKGYLAENPGLQGGK